MNRAKRTRRSARRRGVIAVKVAILIIVLLGFTALAVDMGAIYDAKAELQRTADAAVLAAAAALAAPNEAEPTQLAIGRACEYAAANTVWGDPMQLEPATDVTFGRATFDEATGTYVFTPTDSVPNAVRVRARKTADSPNGAFGLYFAKVLGKGEIDLSATATAMMVPRDIALVADLSGSMNDDSELKNVHEFPVNLFDVWCRLPIPKGNAGVGNGLDPPPPGNPNNENDQPGTGPGSPDNAGGNPYPGADPHGDDGLYGPRWGWMTGWGSDTPPDAYDPSTDNGLYYIPRYSDTTDADVIENLTVAGYTASERAALLSGANDSNSTYYINRASVMLGLAGWKSKKRAQIEGQWVRDSKFKGGPGNGDDIVDNNELWQELDYHFDEGSWNDYVSYVTSGGEMDDGDPGLRYRFGIKTVVNYLLEKKPGHSQTPELADTPAQPVQAVKDSVEHLAELLDNLNTDDQVSLEIYATTARHEMDLTQDFAAVASHLDGMQAGHYDVWTNMGGGITRANEELSSERARSAVEKVIFLLTDGYANVNADGNTNDYPGGKAYARQQADAAVDLGIRIFCISVGSHADTDLMAEIAETGSGQHFHAEGTIDQYRAQLEEIFRTLGGQRTVKLID